MICHFTRPVCTGPRCGLIDRDGRQVIVAQVPTHADGMSEWM
jgi:hypothetical protein